MKANISTYIPAPLLERVERAARAEDRSRSAYIRRALERALTGQERLDALKEIATSGLGDYANATGERAPNATEIIAESSTDGHRRLEALQKIAEGGK